MGPLQLLDPDGLHVNSTLLFIRGVVLLANHSIRYGDTRTPNQELGPSIFINQLTFSII